MFLLPSNLIKDKFYLSLSHNPLSCISLLLYLSCILSLPPDIFLPTKHFFNPFSFALSCPLSLLSLYLFCPLLVFRIFFFRSLPLSLFRHFSHPAFFNVNAISLFIFSRTFGLLCFLSLSLFLPLALLLSSLSFFLSLLLLAVMLISKREPRMRAFLYLAV